MFFAARPPAGSTDFSSTFRSGDFGFGPSSSSTTAGGRRTTGAPTSKGGGNGRGGRLSPIQRRILYVLLCGLAITFLATFFYHWQLPGEVPDKLQQEAHIHATPTQAFCSKHRPPLVCAHGGDSERGAPPNTKTAFQAAIDSGADCVEVDAARTRDGQLVVLHVRELQQLLQLNGTPNAHAQVGDFAMAELRRLRWHTGDRAMLVEEAVRMTSPFVDCVTLDVKTYQGKGGQPTDEDAISEALVRLVHATGCDNCLIWAKSDAVVRRVKDLSPGQRTGYIVMNETEDARRDGMQHPLRMDAPEVVGMHFPMVDPEMLRRLHSAGKQVIVWTVNSAEVLHKVLDVAVDGIVTNHPRMAQEAVEHRVAQCGEVAAGRATGRKRARLDPDDYQL